MKRNLGPFVLAVTGLLLIAGGLGYNWLSNATAEPKAAVLPGRVAGLPQSQADYGVAAVNEVTRLHGQSFRLTSGAHGVYGNRDETATLWVTGAPSRLIAARMVTAMDEAIAASDSPFTPLGVRRINGRSVYALTGLGQQHFYFRSAATIIWLTADEGVAEAALAELLDFYP
jgi:hypothetical protein